MAKKQYRPLDQFNETLEDKEAEQLSNFEFDLNLDALNSTSIGSQAMGHDLRSKDVTKEKQAARQYIDKSVETEALTNYAMSNPYNPLLSDEFYTSGGNVYDPLNEPTDSDNFWNLTFNIANTIHIESLEGQKMQYDFEIEDFKKEAMDLDPNAEDYEESLKSITEDIEKKEQQKLNIDEKIGKTHKELEDKNNQVSALYKAKARAGQEDEGTGMLNYLGSAESAEDLGGALSDIKWMSMGMALGATAAFAPSVMAGSTGYGIPLGVGMMATGIIGGGITQFQMRDNESLAEMRSSYTERLTTLIENFKIDNNGEHPSDEQVAVLDAQAKEGLYAMYRQNMMLTGSDVAQIMLPMVPIGKLLQVGKLPFMAKKVSDNIKRLGRATALIGAESALEGHEEAYQYMTKEQYKLGMYDRYEEADYPWLKTVLNTPYVGDRAIEGMVDMFRHRSGKGLTNTQEFRNSTRAGAALGFFMGGAMGLTVQPAIEKSAKYTERRVLGSELESLGAFSNTSWEELLDVEQASNKTEAIVNDLERNGGKNIFRAFRLFKEDQEDAGNPNEIDFDKLEKSLRTTTSIYKAFKERNPNLTKKELINLTKGYELLTLYKEKAANKSNLSRERKEEFQKSDGFTSAFSGKNAGLESAHNLSLEIKAIEELLQNNKDSVAEAKKLNRYSKTNLERDMLEKTKSKLEEALSGKKKILEGLLVSKGSSIEEISALQTTVDTEIIETAKSEIGSEVQGIYLEELRAPLANPKEAFNLQNHVFLRDLFETDKKAEEAQQDAADNKKEEEESVPTDDSEVEVGDKAWYEGMPFEFLGKVGEFFSLKPLSKTGGFPIMVGKAIFEGLRKLVKKEAYEAEVEEIVNEDHNNTSETEDAAEGKKSSDTIKNRKKKNKTSSENKDEGQKLADESKEPVVGAGKQFRLFLEAQINKAVRYLPNIAYKKIDTSKTKQLSKDNEFFHNRSKAEIEELDVEYSINTGSLPTNQRTTLRDEGRKGTLISFLKDPKNYALAKELLEKLIIKVKLEDGKGKETFELYNANKAVFESETNEEFNNMVEAFGGILTAFYNKKNVKDKIKGSIAHTNYGAFNNLLDENGIPVKNSIPETFRDRFENERLLFGWQNSETQLLIGDIPIIASFQKGGKEGAIYLLYKHKVEGQTQIGTPMKLNSRRLNNTESSVLFDVYQKIVLSRKGQVFTFDSDFTFKNLFKGVSANQVINFLIPRTNGVRIDNVLNERNEKSREKFLEEAEGSEFTEKNGIRLDTTKGEETRLLFGVNFLGQKSAETFNIESKIRIIYERAGDKWNRVVSTLTEEGWEVGTESQISEEKMLKEVGESFNAFARKNIYHQISGPLLNHSIFDFKGFEGTDESSQITFFGKEYTKGNIKESLYSNMLITGKDPVLFTDLEAIGEGDNKRVQINRQVVIDPTDISLESAANKKETPKKPAPKKPKKPTPKPTPEPTEKTTTEEEAVEEKITGGDESLKDVELDEDEFMVVDAEVDKTFPLINIEEARAYLKKVLGTKVPVHIIEGLLRVGKQGRQAYASFSKGIVTLSTMGRKSSEYHEALHAVENVYLNETQRKKLNEEIAKKYGEPTKEELAFIMNERGFTEEQARHYLLSDKRAEEFRAYELGRLDLTDLSDKLKFWYDTLKDYLMVLFKGLHSRRLYYKISQGQYAKDVKTTALFREEENLSEIALSNEEQNLEDAGFNSTDRFNIAKTLLQGFLKKSVNRLNENEEIDLVFIKDFADIKNFLNTQNIIDVIHIIRDRATTTEEQKENLQVIEDNIDAFITEEDTGLIVDILKKASVSFNTEEEYKDSLDSNDDLKSQKSPFEFSALDSSNMATRLLFDMIPQRNEDGNIIRDPRTGLGIMADGTYIFTKMQELLSGIDHIYNEEGVFVSGMEQMRERLLAAESNLPVLKGFVPKMLDKLTKYQLSQFYKVLNMKNYEFKSLITSSSVSVDDTGKAVTKKHVRLISSAVESLLYRIQEQWYETYKSTLFKYGEENEEIVKDVKGYKSILDSFKMFYELYKNVPEKITPEETARFSEDLSNLLEKIGIEVPKDGIYKYVTSQAGGVPMGIGNILKGIGNRPGVRQMFSSKKDNSVQHVYDKLNKETGVTDKDFNLDTENTLKNFSSITKLLAEIAAMSEKTLLSNTTRVGKKTYWNYSQGNYIFNSISRFTNSLYEVQDRLKDRWSNSSLYLNNIIKEDVIRGTAALAAGIKESLKIITFGESRDRDSNKPGKTYKELATREFIIDSINKMFANKEGVVNFPTFADKSVWYMLQGAQIIDLKSEFVTYNAETDSINIDPNSNDAAKLINIFSRYIIEEADRIIQTKEDLETLKEGQLTKTFHFTKKNEDGTWDRASGNALKMMIFPELNNEEILEKVGLTKGGKWLQNKDIASIKRAVSPYIISSLEGQMQKDLNKLVENNIIVKNEASYSFTHGKLDPIDSKIRNTFGNPIKLLGSFTANSIIANIETTKMFSGDIAYYKSYEDLTKRIVAIIAPGQSLNLTTESFYRAAVVEDYTLNSAALVKNYSKFLVEKLGYTEDEAAQVLRAYNDVNVTDGQAYITLERWRDLMVGLGDIDEDVIQGAYERLNDPKAKPTEEDVRLVMAQPLKGMLFSRRASEVHGKLEQIPTYLKYSQAVLIPAFVENQANMGELLKAMRNQKVDEVVFESAIKAGALSPIKIADENGKIFNAEDIAFNVMTLDNRDWKLQQPLSPHETNEQLEGSQVKKNILSGIKLLQKYSVPYSFKEGKKWKKGIREIFGYELVEEFHSVDRALSDYEFSKLSEEWGLEWNPSEGKYTIQNMEALQKALVKDFSRDDGIPDKIIQLLSLKDATRGNTTVKEFLIAFDNNPFDDVIERKLSSIITKRLIKLLMPGGSYIQTSAFGMTKPTRFTNLTKTQQKELKSQMFPEGGLNAAMWDEKTGRAIGAQIFLPNYMKKLIPNNAFATQEGLQKYIQDNRLLEAVGYRIPNQGMSSIDALQVVGFLPQAYGDTVIAYDEITAKTGSDFDIDKMYIMLPSFSYVYEKDENGKNTDTVKGVRYVDFDSTTSNIEENIGANKGNKNYSKALKNRKLELYKAILQDENTFAQLINPLDSMVVKNDSMLVRYLEAKNNIVKEDIESIESLYKFENGEYVFEDSFYGKVNEILSKNVANLEWFGFSKQVDIREIYLGGQFGVGQLARHTVDQAISQHSPNWKKNGLESPYYFGGIDLGIGNVTPEGSSDLSQVWIKGKEEKFAIASILSARLDGYVDIAADPAIFYINNNALTANTVALMDRLGTNPQWTDMFMSLPLMKEFVAITKNITSGNIPKLSVIKDGKTEEKTFYKAENYITTRLQQEINSRLSEEYRKESLSDVRAYNLAKNDGRVKAAARKGIETEGRVKVEDIYSIEDLANLIDSRKDEVSIDDLYTQLALFTYFMELRAKGSILNKAVTASKYDTQGARGGFSQAMLFEGLQEELLSEESPLIGFKERFEKTMVGKYKEHGPDLMQQLFGEMFLLGNDTYRSVLRRIATATRHKREVTENEEYIRTLHRNFRSFLYTETEYFKSINIKELLYGKDNIVVRLSKAKEEDSAIKNNLLIKYLSPKGQTQNDGFVYISAPARIAKSGKDKNALTNAWEDLLKSPDKKIRKLAEDLYKFSIVSSGFRNGSFTFHELVPLDYEMETGIYDQFGRITNELKQTGDPNNDLTTRFMVSQMNNTDVVPEADGKVDTKEHQGAAAIASQSKDIYILSIKEKFSYQYLVSPLVKEDGEIVEYPEYVPFITIVEGSNSQRRLYRFEGLQEVVSEKEGTSYKPVYSIMNNYTYANRGIKLYEHIDLTKESSIVQNNKRSTKKETRNGKTVNVRRLFFTNEAYSSARAGLTKKIANTVTISIDDIIANNVEAFSLAPWSNELTAIPDTSTAEEQPTLYEGEILSPEHLLESPIVVYVDSKLKRFNSIQEAIDNGVSLEDAVQLAAKYNLEIQEEIDSLLEDMSYIESMDNNYGLPGYGLAIKRAKMLIESGAIGFQRLENPQGKDTFINVKPVYIFMEELSETISKIDYLENIRNMINPYIENSNYEVVTVISPKDKMGGVHLSELDEKTKRLEGSTIIMEQSTSDKRNAVTLLHEVLHAFTGHAVLKGGPLYEKTKALSELYYEKFNTAKNMPAIFRRYMEEYKANPTEETERKVQAEFITYGLTDKNMVTQLKNLIVKPENVAEGQLGLFGDKIESAFNKLVGIVLEAFGMTKGTMEVSAYNLLKDMTAEFLEQGASLKDDNTYREKSILDILNSSERDTLFLRNHLKDNSSILERLNENIKKIC